ncbi:amidohydrolase family protein [Cupriavidus pauculus]|uniref:amidohydrolase family protein n=1 Tax=Cupriavidus pauculus TaxID=82633 RepID=UPI001EE1E119|nr:amidohydrolase family protein [Cupriavidus pauculus]GJG94253.1 amidohydrolase [Cupriavidus pauculus]
MQKQVGDATAEAAVSAGRRQVLACALGLAAGLPTMAGAAEPAAGGARTAVPDATRGRIDVHAHYIPDRYRTALEAAGQSKPSGMPAIPKWSAAQHVGMMDHLGIATAMLSISAPGLHFGDDAAARKLARYCNEEGARAVASHTGRFGLFAALPLPDVPGTLAELRYAFDTLHADGVVMESNYHGIYLGDPRFDPVMAELNRRRAVIFIHPTDPHCACCQGTDAASLPPLGYPYPMIEFIFDTTRAVFNLILSGTLARYPDIRIIVPHAGAAVPVLAARVAAISGMLKLSRERVDMDAALQKLYYDLAGVPEPIALGALLQAADPVRILYGSDYPFTPEPVAAELAAVLDRSAQIPPAMRRAFMRDNALALFPRLLQA